MIHRLLPIVLGAAAGLLGLTAVDRVLACHQRSALVAAPAAAGLWRSHFPDVELHTHDGRTVRFYDDLIRGKIVGIHFMYVGCTRF